MLFDFSFFFLLQGKGRHHLNPNVSVSNSVTCRFSYKTFLVSWREGRERQTCFPNDAFVFRCNSLKHTRERDGEGGSRRFSSLSLESLVRNREFRRENRLTKRSFTSQNKRDRKKLYCLDKGLETLTPEKSSCRLCPASLVVREEWERNRRRFHPHSFSMYRSISGLFRHVICKGKSYICFVDSLYYFSSLFAVLILVLSLVLLLHHFFPASSKIEQQFHMIWWYDFTSREKRSIWDVIRDRNRQKQETTKDRNTIHEETSCQEEQS